MNISKLDLRLSDEFIRAEINKHPGATIKEIQEATKKKFGRSTSYDRVTRIRNEVLRKEPNQEFQDLAKHLAIKMKSTSFISIAFVKEGKKVKVSWQHEKISTEQGSTLI